MHLDPKQPTPIGGTKVLKMYTARNHYVVKQNELIQQTRYRLTANEQKLILHLIQMINPKRQSLTFHLNVHEYAKFIGVKDTRVNVRRIKQDLKKLNSKSFWMNRHLADGHEHEQLVQWFALIDRDKQTGIFTLRFDDRLKPFLLKTKQFFTKYDYYYIMAMKSAYSIRLYEYFISYYTMQNNRVGLNYSLKQLLHMLDLESTKSYRHFYNLNRRVLKPAVKEINRYSDLNIRIKSLKKGRKVTGVNVLLTKKNKRQLFNTGNLIQRHLSKHKDY